MKKLLLGLAPTRRFCFSVEDAHKYKKLIEEKLRDFEVDFVNIDEINDEGLLIHMEDAYAAIELFQNKKVDAVFVPHVNFGTEEVVATLCKAIHKPVLLWGPRDEMPMENGVRLRDTLCGIFATSNVLQKMGVQYTYIINSRVNDPEFIQGLNNFIAAATVVKAFIGARIGQISTRPPNFYTVITNEQDLLLRWGIEMVPISAQKFVTEVSHMADHDLRIDMEINAIKAKIDIANTPEHALRQIAAMKLWMLDWAQQENLSAIAIRCHEDIPESLACYSCFANAEVTAAGIPVACETDIHGALSSILLQHAQLTTRDVFFADVTIRHPHNDNAVLLWHCGNFPLSLCKASCKPYLCGHCNIAPGLPGTGNFEIEASEITVCRFDGIAGEYKLFVGEGKAVEGPFCRGTYVWMGVDNWACWEEKLVNGPYVHHVAGVKGHCGKVLVEACRYIPTLSADPACKLE